MIEAAVTMKRGTFALHGDIRCSGLTGLTGANGSGKTSLLHILTGLYPPEKGKVVLNGRDITELPMQERGVVYLSPETYFGHMTVVKHLSWGIRTKSDNNSGEGVERIKEEIGIDFSGKLSSLSVGQRGRVILGTALAARPEVIILDELLANVSDRERIMQYLKRVSRNSYPDIIFVSQEQSDLNLADQVYRMVEGTSERVR